MKNRGKVGEKLKIVFANDESLIGLKVVVQPMDDCWEKAINEDWTVVKVPGALSSFALPNKCFEPVVYDFRDYLPRNYMVE